ncbi:MAG: enoyl-CoA hydratase [Candidatus Obscuribacterales bacterium]|nr:enoyl-CoA hydratase [Steroidobacteraceae bacterium]
MTHFEDILYAVKDRIATITFNRPDKLNAWTAAMQSSVKRAMIAAANDESVRIIVITGAGRGFCAGADMGSLQKIEPGKAEERELARGDGEIEVDEKFALGPDVTAHYGGRFGYLMSIRKPIIAAINGPCAGIGLVFALYCDLRFAAADAKFTTSFAQRGLVAEHGISWLLPRITGIANALDILFSARKFSAEEAARINLVNRVFPQDAFIAAVMDYARQLADTVSPRSLAVMKAQIWKALYQDMNDAIAIGDAEMHKSFATADFKEGVAHFVEKRAPHFTGH